MRQTNLIKSADRHKTLSVPPHVKEHNCPPCSFLELCWVLSLQIASFREGFPNQNYHRISVVRVTTAVHQYLTLNRWNKLAVAQLTKTCPTFMLFIPVVYMQLKEMWVRQNTTELSSVIYWFCDDMFRPWMAIFRSIAINRREWANVDMCYMRNKNVNEIVIVTGSSLLHCETQVRHISL
jgi:hypothetical protein